MTTTRSGSMISILVILSISLHKTDAINCTVVSSCLMKHFGTIKTLMVESQALSRQASTSRDESEAKMDHMCASFQPLIDCTGRDAAVQCQFKIGKRGQVFRLYFLVILCDITVKLRKCNKDYMTFLNATTTPIVCPYGSTTVAPTTPPGYFEKSVCSQQFPDIENQTEQYRDGFTTPAMSLPDDPYEELSNLNKEKSMNGVADAFYKMGRKCDRLNLYVGCWLHYSKDMCGDQATEIIQNIYEIYNDLSGRQCSKENPSKQDFLNFERSYIDNYGAKTTPSPCPTEPTTPTSKSEINVNEVDVAVTKGRKLTQRPTRPPTRSPYYADLYEDYYEEDENSGSNVASVSSVLILSLMIVICSSLW